MKIVKRIPKDSILACARWTALEPLMLPDNVVGKCAECGQAIQHRPHAPKKMRKVCMFCAAPDIAEGAESVTTKQMLEDFKTYKRGQKQ
ncbi:hypothetical protein [Bradyrhizobium sp. 150]|uniref:hypothetical protein n=1 Tax=Bradyrhizobium sp. 150 TaxID=2782625 RepID=UPI001FF9492F|nr:hypothetical protein [Bradyrhizobium sp. 150]MCK1670353.1 hypothetical protein [Bradyrhizobium sp. 150]